MLLQHLAKPHHDFFTFTEVSWGNFIFKSVQPWTADLTTKLVSPFQTHLWFPRADKTVKVPLANRIITKKPPTLPKQELYTTLPTDALIGKSELWDSCPFQGSNMK